MSARDDYPDPSTDTDYEAMCAELDGLRRVLMAAWAWKRCKYAMHGNTSEASQRHYQAVQFAERFLSGAIDEFVAEFCQLDGVER